MNQFQGAISVMEGVGVPDIPHPISPCCESHERDRFCHIPACREAHTTQQAWGATASSHAHLHHEVEKKLWDQTEKWRGVWESLCLCRDTGHTHWAGSSISTNTSNGFSPPQVPSFPSPWYLVDLFWVYSKDSSMSLLLILLSAPWAMLKRPWISPIPNEWYIIQCLYKYICIYSGSF